MAFDDALADIRSALSADPQQTAQAPATASIGPDAVLADLAKSPEQLRAEIGTPAKAGGVAHNLGAGINDFLAGGLGAPVDAMTWALNKGHGVLTGNEQPWITNPAGGSESIKSAMGWVGADPREVGINNTADTMARNVGQNVGAMVSPYMAGRAMIANGVTAGIPGAVARLFGGPAPADAGIARTALGAAGNAAIGAGASLGGQGAESLLPEGSPWRPLADFGGQIVGGGLMAGGMAAGKAGLNLGAGYARDFLGPLNPSMRQGIVADKLRSASSDPAALARSLDVQNPELVPGSLPTTYQLSGDQGIGRLQGTLDQTPFQARAAEQNAARVGALQNLAPEDASPGAVRDFLQQRLAQIDAAGDANVTAAQRNAQQAFDQAGGMRGAQDYGALMRDQLEGAKAATKRQESALWQAIDPEGNLTISAVPVREQASTILKAIPSTAKPAEGEERAIFGLAQMSPTNMPFSDFAALRSRLLGAIREEAANGQTPALRRMQQLRSAMDGAISDTANTAAQRDPALIARLSQNASEVYGGNNASAAAIGTGGQYGPGSSGLSASGSQLASGGFGAAGEARGRSGSAPGYSSVPTPRRPENINDFLISRGGVFDEGGELRASDLNRPQKGQFGILSTRNGLSLDYAREAAEEAGFLRPGSTINDLHDAIQATSRGNPVYRPEDAVDWKLYEAARRRGEFDLPPLPGESHEGSFIPAPATWDADAATRYRAAADATRARAQTFNNPQIGPVLQERGGMYRMAESRIPERFISSPEGVQAFLNAGGDRETLGSALAADLRRSATNPDGSLNTIKFASWQMRRAPALQAFPELQETLGNAANAQNAVDTVASQARQQLLDFQRGAARHFLNAEPMQSVRSALNGKNLVRDFKALSAFVGSDPDAKSGLQRAVADYIAQSYVRNPQAGATVGSIKPDAFATFLNRTTALREAFSPEQMKAMQDVAADLQRAAQPLPKGQNGAIGGAPSLLRGYVFGHGAAGLAGVAGYLFGGVHGALEAFGGYEVAKKALDAMTRAGVERTDQLLTEALLNPELARTLLMKATPGNRPFIAQRLSSQLGSLAAVGGTSAAGEGQSSNPRRPVTLPAMSRAVPPASVISPTLAPGGALSGGLLGAMAR